MTQFYKSEYQTPEMVSFELMSLAAICQTSNSNVNPGNPFGNNEEELDWGN